MAFRGWPAEALEFFEGLEADNSRQYWQTHKDTYERAVKAPMEALLADLAPQFGPGKIFRPHRDVRFNPDKSPYKTHMGATLATGGYIELSAQGLATGSGYWHMAPDQLIRYRAAVDDETTGSQLGDLVAALGKSDIETISRESLKTAPKGYPKDHPRIDLLRHKGLATWRRWPVASWLGTARAKDRIVSFLQASLPVNQWLDTHVGPSTAEHT